MKIKEAQIGQEVVRTKGQDMIGCIGNILDINYDKNKVVVSWGHNKTTLDINSIEPTSKPYKIEEAYNYQDKRTGAFKIIWAKYIAL